MSSHPGDCHAFVGLNDFTVHQQSIAAWPYPVGPTPVSPVPNWPNPNENKWKENERKMCERDVVSLFKLLKANQPVDGIELQGDLRPLPVVCAVLCLLCV